MEKPKVAFFSFTCCEGCQLVVLSLEEELPQLLRHIEIVNFREAMTEKREDYEIAFIEGSISRKDEVKRLKDIRKRAKAIVSLGACSSIGGINCLKNRFPIAAVKTIAYGKGSSRYRHLDTLPVRPIDSIIKVDHYIHGCPIPKNEFLKVITSLLLRKTPEITNHPVCVDCKMAGNICVFERGETCLGPVTRAGCDAVCVTYGCICWGCRGLVDDPNTNSHKETLERYGLSLSAVIDKFDLYDQCKRQKT